MAHSQPLRATAGVSSAYRGASGSCAVSQILAIVFALFLALIPLGAPCESPEEPGDAERDSFPSDSAEVHPAPPDPSLALPAAEVDPSTEAREALAARWFVLAGMVNTYPRLESEHLIEKYFNPAMRLFAPGFDNVTTVGTLRDDHFLWPPHLGFGLVLSPKWALFIQMGYTAGKVRTKADDISIFLLPLHTDFEIYRGAFYTGLCLDYFPWGMPPLRKYRGLGDRLRHARPVLGLRVNDTYATYESKVKVGFKPMPNLVDLHLSDEWWVPSIEANVGVDVPLSERNQLTFNAGYNFPCRRHGDFEGAAFTVGIKHFFQRKKSAKSPARRDLDNPAK